MSLPPRQQLILDQIEHVLQVTDPRLNSMFAAFGRSAQARPVPATEVVPRFPVRVMVMICLIIVSTVSVLVIGIRATSGNDCSGQATASEAARSGGCGKSTSVWEKR